MRRLSSIRDLGLLLILGTFGTFSDSLCQQTIGVDPTVLHVPYTAVGSHFDTSYTVNAGGFGWGSDGIGSLAITCPDGFGVAWSASGPWVSSSRSTGWKADSFSHRYYLRYTPTSSAGNAGTIVNDLYQGNFDTYLATANVQIVDDPLPIQLASFQVSAPAGRGVELKWTTVSETNNYGFHIQRDSIDVAFIQGQGTTLIQHSYSYSDKPAAGRHAYRLRQVDMNGAAALSETVLIDVKASMTFAISQNYPNPFNPSTRITFSTTKDGPVSLKVFDVLGREVATLVNESRKAGKYTEQFNGSQCASGVYMYVLGSAEGQLTGTMLLLK